MKDPALRARYLKELGVYQAAVRDDWSKVILVRQTAGGIPAKELGNGNLPRLSGGDTLLLELRVQGRHLTLLANDRVVLEADDDKFAGPGAWGISALDGWFESAEIRTLASGAAQDSSLPAKSQALPAATDKPRAQ
jgi:hypothetical protein